MSQTSADTPATPWHAHRTVMIAWLLCLPPVGLYAPWRSEYFEKRTRWIVTGGVVLLLAHLPTPGQMGGISGGGQCAATFTQGQCTYFRDDRCNVIGKTCN